MVKTSVGRVLGVSLGLALSLTLAVGAVGPSATHAASPRLGPVLLWSGPAVQRSLEPGRETAVTAQFRVTHTIHNAVFSVRLNSGLRARPTTLLWGTITPSRWHDLAFVVSVPLGTRPGRYLGTVVLERVGKIDNDRDVDRRHIGAPLTIVIQVVRAPLVTFSPADLGRIVVLKGQTVTETVPFVSSTALTNVQLGRYLSPYALSQGVSVTPVGISPATTSIAANTPYSVTFTIATAANTTTGLYGADVFLRGSYNGGPVVQLGRSLHATIDVRKVYQIIDWTPDGLGSISLAPGQTLTKTASFVSNVALTGVQLARELPDAAVSRGVSINLLGISPAATTIAPNVPYTVTFTASAAPTAPSGSYTGALYLLGSYNGAPVARLWHQEGFVVNVVVPSPVVAWPSGKPVSYPTIQRGPATVSVTETASFSSNVALSNVTLAGSLSSKATAQGITFTPVAIQGGSAAAGVATPVSFVLSVPPTAAPGVYSGYVWAVGQPAGASAPQALSQKMHFVFAVN